MPQTELAQRNKTAELKLVREIVPPGVSCVYLRQPEALGLGHAVLCAEHIVDEEPFFVVLADDLIHTQGDNCLQQMRTVAEARGASVLGLQRVPRAETRKYGVIAPEPAGERTHAVTRIVEKPTPDAAPSDLAVVGRYVLTPGIFRELHATGRGTGGEIQLTDGIQALLAREKVYGLEYEGQRYDCGSKLGYLQATVELGLEHPELGAEFRAWLVARRGG